MPLLSAEKSVIDVVQFPMPDEQVVLIDLDGTLVRPDSSLGHPEIYKTMQVAQEKGWLIGLNSNRTLEVLRFWGYCLAIDGPLIAEGGAIVQWGGEVHHTDPRVQSVAGLYAAANRAAQRSLAAEGVMVWNDTDPVRALVEGRIERQFRDISDPGDVLSVFTASRQLGTSVFVRVVEQEGRLVQVPSATEGVAKHIGPFLLGLGTPMLHHDIGLVGATQELTTKRHGVEVFRDMTGITGRIAMIGNTSSDFIGQDLAVHYAVGDARDFREADYVAHSSNTAGVVEIMGRLAARPIAVG